MQPHFAQRSVLHRVHFLLKVLAKGLGQVHGLEGYAESGALGGDGRGPDEICAGGFSPKNPSAGLSVAQHVEGVPDTGSNWISTTHDVDTTKNFGGDGYVYKIANPGCGTEVDCDPDLIDKYGADPTDSEHEIAFNRDIPPGNILGYWKKGADPSTSQACP